jgi:hypothetical protein
VTTICRSFRQDFPEFVARAESLGVGISLGEGRRKGKHDRVFWLDGYRQLSGYTTRQDGQPFTRDDAARHVDKVLTEIETDRRAVAALTADERFARVMAEFRQIKPQYRMIGEVRLPNGDRGHCFFMADYDGGVSIAEIGEVAKARVKWSREAQDTTQLARFCDALEADYARRANADPR